MDKRHTNSANPSGTSMMEKVKITILKTTLDEESKIDYTPIER